MNTTIGISLLVRTIFPRATRWFHNLLGSCLEMKPKESLVQFALKQYPAYECQHSFLFTTRSFMYKNTVYMRAPVRLLLNTNKAFFFVKVCWIVYLCRKTERKNRIVWLHQKKKTVQILYCKHNLTHAKNCLKHWQVIDLPGADNSLGNSLMPYVAIWTKIFTCGNIIW